ncbi:MAG: M20 family metallopeptidase, partial [Clostridiales bacterium]|nr:M20 family metallopeptidase [Clostridiales bacterium]
MDIKTKIDDYIEEQKEQLWAMADAIFDKPEQSFEETFASDLLAGALEQRGFKVKKGLGFLLTAFKAVYKQG